MEREKQIVLTQGPGHHRALADQVARIVRFAPPARPQDRRRCPRPSTGPHAHLLGVETVDNEIAASTSNILLKYQSDIAKAVREFTDTNKSAARPFTPGPK